ncbi:MAG: hypothetical protein VX089_01485 [Pseudomonadota bacterium]|nr:hypothetical protein [Pseudomonadota bacterium]
MNSSWIGLIAWLILFMSIYSAKVSKDKKKWAVLIFIILIFYSTKGFFKTSDITEGSNVFRAENSKISVFEKELPPVIFEQLNRDFKITFPKSIAGSSTYLFDKAVTQIFDRSRETRKVNSINWNSRYALQLSAFNNTKYNAYGSQQPQRDLLPFFVKYTFPKEYNQESSKICWQGQAYLKLKEYVSITHTKKECILIKDYFKNYEDNFIIWFIETGKTPKLKVSFFPPKKIALKNYFFLYFKAFLAIIICFFMFNSFNKFRVIAFFLSFSFSMLLMYLFNPTILDKYVLFEGGNDGLLYVHFAHLIADSLSENNYIEAFRGGEDAYDLMPFYRYLWVLNYIFFQESPWIILFTLIFIPLVLFDLIRNILGKSWAIFLIACWCFFPLFEAFGFFHFYYVKLAMRGFAEPLSYLFFFSVLNIIASMYKKDKSLITGGNITYLIMGFLLSLALGLRANILPAFLVVLIFIFASLYKENKYKNIAYLFLGLIPCLIMPLHNFYFTGKFIPLTIAAYKDWNLGASPKDYVIFVISLLKLNFDMSVWNKITSHISGEIKIYEVWYHLSIFSVLYVMVKKNIDPIIRIISWAAFAMLCLILFYHVGGRYSYITWTLCLIVFFYWLKNIFIPYLKKKKALNVP